MDDGYWPLSIVIFAAFILLDAVLYGFGAAIQHLNSGMLEKEAQEGNKKAERLLAVISQPAEFIGTVQIVTNLIGLVSGAVILKEAGALLELLIHRTGETGEGFSLIAATAAAGGSDQPWNCSSEAVRFQTSGAVGLPLCRCFFCDSRSV